jgi:hypothetical protein
MSATDGKVLQLFEGVVDNGAIAHVGTHHLISATLEQREQFLESVEAHHGTRSFNCRHQRTYTFAILIILRGACNDSTLGEQARFQRELRALPERYGPLAKT